MCRNVNDNKKKNSHDLIVSFSQMISGDILKSHVKTALPYLTPLMKITVSGKTLMEALEHCASLLDYKNCAIPEENIYGSFIQMSGNKGFIRVH